MFLRICFILIVALTPAVARAQEVDNTSPIDVVEVSGLIDRPGVEFITRAIEEAADDGAQAVILQIDSPGAVTPSIADAIDLVRAPPLPVIAWVGPAPAVAQGGGLELAAAAELTLAAPGARVGHSSPLVVGGSGGGSFDLEALRPVEAPDEIVDGVEPALGSLIVGLHGRTFAAGSGEPLVTATEVTNEDGTVRQQVVPQIRFQEPGVVAKTTRLALRPEAIFFFLVAGLSFAAFEFYAIGPGLAAATAAVPLLLAGYGLVTMPFGWGLLVAAAAMWLLVADYQRGGFGVLSYVASPMLVVGGLFVVGGRPQVEPSIASTVVIAIGVILFFVFAMPTVARSRFTTQTMGREYLVGRSGTALSAAVDGGLDVDVDGATWRATTYRESEIVEGTPVRVEAVQGLYLEVVEIDIPGVQERENNADGLE